MRDLRGKEGLAARLAGVIYESLRRQALAHDVKMDEGQARAIANNLAMVVVSYQEEVWP